MPTLNTEISGVVTSGVTTSGADHLPLGIPALLEELRSQGVEPHTLFSEAGLSADAGLAQIEPADLPAIINAAARLGRNPDTALAAGTRQKINHFGVFGFALISSRNFGEAFRFGSTHIDLAGGVLEVDFSIVGGTGVLKTRQPIKLSQNIQFIAEYWRSSMTTLLSAVLGRAFPSTDMYFPYSRPANSRLYEQLFNCQLHFGSKKMEWHFDASVLDEPCPSADPLTSQICQDICNQLVIQEHEPQLIRLIKNLCMTNSSRARATAESVAYALQIPLRTFHRRLTMENTTFKKLHDETRYSLAAEYLMNTSISVEEISERCGYGDISNFRKAFKRWSGSSPSNFRLTTDRPSR